jgi:hypothetical protein
MLRTRQTLSQTPAFSPRPARDDRLPASPSRSSHLAMTPMTSSSMIGMSPSPSLPRTVATTSPSSSTHGGSIASSFHASWLNDVLCYSMSSRSITAARGWINTEPSCAMPYACVRACAPRCVRRRRRRVRTRARHRCRVCARRLAVERVRRRRNR